MTVFKKLPLILPPIILTYFLLACSSNIQSIKVDRDVDLQQREGYLLVSVNTNIGLNNFELTGPQNYHLKDMIFYRGSSYFLAAVPAGTYRIKNIDTGLYSRYQFDEEDGLWSFQVKPNVISYVGELRVRQKSYRRSSFELINNSSLALEYLEEKYPNILATRKVEYYGPGEDSFFPFVLQTKVEISESPSL